MAVSDRIMDATKYMISLPKTEISVFLIIIVSFLSGCFVGCLEPNPSAHAMVFSVFSEGTTAFFLLGLTGIASGGIIHGSINHLHKRHMKLKQAMFVAFVGTLIPSIFYLIGSILSVIFHNSLTLNILLLGVLFAFAIEVLVLWSTSNIRYIEGVVIAAIQPVLILSMLVLINYVTVTTSASAILSLYLKAIIGAFVLAVAVYAFISIVQTPIKNNLGVGGLELLSLFIAQITEGSNAMEEIFNVMGEPIDTSVSLISFRTSKGIKANYISPHVHPGPVGSIGGGNLPTIVANQLDDFAIIAHGAATHDFNPVKESEIQKVTDSINNILKDLIYSKTASKFQRYQAGDAKVGAQFFNNGLILLTTFAPNPGDDIDYGVGKTLMYEAQYLTGADDVVFVDCHNCLKGNYDRLLAGHNRVIQLEDAIKQIKKPEEYPIKMGYAYDALNEIPVKDGIGESGIKLMLTEVDTQRMLYVVIDGNNMKKGFREEIIKTINNKYPDIDMIEVMTTDTHLVNTISGGGVTVGEKHSEEIINAILKLIPEAVNDLEYVEVASGTSRINIKTLGPNNSTELMTTITSVLSISKILAPFVFFVAAIITILWIF